MLMFAQSNSISKSKDTKIFYKLGRPIYTDLFRFKRYVQNGFVLKLSAGVMHFNAVLIR